MAKVFDFQWQIAVPESLLRGAVFDRWDEVRFYRTTHCDSVLTNSLFTLRVPMLVADTCRRQKNCSRSPCQSKYAERERAKAAPAELFGLEHSITFNNICIYYASVELFIE